MAKGRRTHCLIPSPAGLPKKPVLKHTHCREMGPYLEDEVPELGVWYAGGWSTTDLGSICKQQHPHPCCRDTGDSEVDSRFGTEPLS